MPVSTLKAIVRSSPLLRRASVLARRQLITWMSSWPISGDIPQIAGPQRLPIAKLKSFAEYSDWKLANAERLDEELTFERDLMDRVGDGLHVPEFCAVCGHESSFFASSACTLTMPDGAVVPNLRESLHCKECHFSVRLRASLHLLIQELHPIRDGGDKACVMIAPRGVIIMPFVSNANKYGFPRGTASSVAITSVSLA